MGKIMKPNRVVLVLSGRYAGRKAIIVKSFDEGTSEKQFGHALVVGIDKYPRRVNKRMKPLKIKRRCKIKPFLKVLNYNHLLPTRYTVTDIVSEQKVLTKDLNDPMKKKKVRSLVKSKFEEKYKQGKHSWFFQRLAF